MQKNRFVYLLGCAWIASLVSANVWADSFVNMYGVVDISLNKGVSKSENGDSKFLGLDSGFLSSSRIGFKGQEDLGGDLKAVFNLEYGIAADAKRAGGALSSRHHWAGLQGSFGKIYAGRVQGLIRRHTEEYSAFDTSDGLEAHDDSGRTVGLSSADNRLDNAIAWNLPRLGDLRLAAIYSFKGEVDQDGNEENQKQRTYQLGAHYVVDDSFGSAFTVGAHYSKTEDAEAAAQLGYGYGREQFGVGSSISLLKFMKVFMFYQSGKIEGPSSLDDRIGRLSFDANGNYVGVDSEVLSLGTWLSLGSGKIVMQYATSNLEVGGQDAKRGSDNYSLAYIHSLSKRTSTYVGYIGGKGEDQGVVTEVASLEDSAPGKRADAFILGLRHKF